MVCQIHEHGYSPTINDNGIIIKQDSNEIKTSNKIRQTYQPME